VLEARDENALAQVLDSLALAGVLVEGALTKANLGEAQSLEARLRRYDHLRPLRGVYLAPAGALYARSQSINLSSGQGDTLARIARAILTGREPPGIASFPEAFRAERNVEMMVMLRSTEGHKLWRSARSTSIGRAAVLAARAARERWREREHALGGALLDMLGTIDVEVAELKDDGTLGARTAGFLDRSVTPHHGVAFEHEGKWRYLLPEEMPNVAKGAVFRAYRDLLAKHGLDLHREGLRLYRIAVLPLGRSVPLLRDAGER
jgi:hypothetical protein